MVNQSITSALNRVDGRVEGAIADQTGDHIHTDDVDDGRDRGGDDRQLADVSEQTVMRRFAGGRVVGNHRAVVPVMCIVQLGLGVVLDDRPHGQAVGHVVEGGGDELQADAVVEADDVLDAVAQVTGIFLVHVVVDVGLADDVAQDILTADAAEGGGGGAAELLLEQRVLHDLRGDRVEVAHGELLDVTTAVSAADEDQLGEVHRAAEDVGDDLVAGDVGGTDIVDLVVGVETLLRQAVLDLVGSVV